MRLIILDKAPDVAEWSARYVMKRIHEFKPNENRYFVLGLPTGEFLFFVLYKFLFAEILGSTPYGMYQKLIEYYKAGKVSFRYVKTFNMDEYVNLPRDHPESYHYYMWNNFFKHIDILPENVHILDGNAPDLVEECLNYEKQIAAAGGIELFVGGKRIIF